jgi:hypothetical protein
VCVSVVLLNLSHLDNCCSMHTHARTRKHAHTHTHALKLHTLHTYTQTHTQGLDLQEVALQQPDRALGVQPVGLAVMQLPLQALLCLPLHLLSWYVHTTYRT